MASAHDNQLTQELTPVQKQVEDNRANGWMDLDPTDRGIAVAFVSCSYSVKETADHLDLGMQQVRRALRRPLVAAYVAELQQDDLVGGMVTKQFVTASLMNLIPKLAGEEEVPLVVDGAQIYAKKFYPGELRAVLETLAKSTNFERAPNKGGSGPVNVQINFGDVMTPGEQPRVTISEGGNDGGE